ncbi:MAG: 2-succinyl-6-hydroxy-2,4-cyclohexadiene-1-carboxylate synthase [Phormidesmis sp.]
MPLFHSLFHSLLYSEHHTLYYITAGEPTKPPLMLLHGFLGSHQDFVPLLPKLSPHFYCIVPDLPGHGQTATAPGSYTFPLAASVLLQLLGHLNIRQTNLLGYSMGGRLALYLTCKFPNGCIRTVLESASPGLKTAEERENRRQHDDAIAHRLETTPLPIFLNHWYQNPLFASLQQHLTTYAAMIARRQQNQPHQLAAALRGFSTGRQPSLWPALPTLSTPLCLLVGALDAKFVRLNREMLTDLTASNHAALNIVENCGHNIHLENPDGYAIAILQYLLA